MSAIIERVLGEPMPSDRIQAAVGVADAAASSTVTDGVDGTCLMSLSSPYRAVGPLR